MVTIAAASSYEPKSTLKTFFNSFTKENRKIKKINKELDEKLSKETILYYPEDDVLLKNVDILKEIDVSMQNLKLSEEGTNALKDFEDMGGSFGTSKKLNVGGSYLSWDVKILLTTATKAKKKPDNETQANLTNTISHELNHAVQDENTYENDYIENIKYDSIQKIMLDAITKESSSKAAEFVTAYQIATNPKEPNKEMLYAFKESNKKIYQAGMKSLGYKEIDYIRSPFVIELKQKSKEDIEKSRVASFKSWGEDKGLIDGYGEYYGEHIFKSKHNKLSQRGKKLDFKKALDVLFVKSGKEKKVENNLSEDDIIDNNFIKICDKCHGEIKKRYLESGHKREAVDELLENYQSFRKNYYTKKTLTNKKRLNNQR
jgi:hypothetical protein